MSATIRDERSYKLDPSGTPGWRILGAKGEYVIVRHDTLRTDYPGHRAHGTPAEVTVPRSHLILADARTAVASAPGEEAAANPITPRPAPGAVLPVDTGGAPSFAVAATTGTAAATVPPAVAAAPIAAGTLDVNRVSGTDRGHTTAALVGHPARPFDSGTPAAPSHRGARNTDPATSFEAAESITDLRRRADHDLVLHLLALHGPLTDFDLARHATQITGRNVQQTAIGVRRGELRNAGLVCDSGFKGKAPSGANSIRWTLTTQGAEVAA